LYHLGARPGENLLDNWYFLDPVNQRRQTEYPDSLMTYTIDRWIINGGKISISATGIKFAQVTGASTFFQRIPTSLLGQVVTFSALLSNNNLITYTGEITSDMTGNDNLFLQEQKGIPICGFIFYAPGEELEIQAAKLELGPVQTLAHQDASGNWVLNDPPPNKALELAKCQRYLQVYGRDIGIGLIAYEISISNGKASFSFVLPQRMRANPTIINNNGISTRLISSGSDLPNSEYTFVGAQNNIGIQDTNANISIDTTYVCGTNPHNGTIIISAEL